MPLLPWLAASWLAGLFVGHQHAWHSERFVWSLLPLTLGVAGVALARWRRRSIRRTFAALLLFAALAAGFAAAPPTLVRNTWPRAGFWRLQLRQSLSDTGAEGCRLAEVLAGSKAGSDEGWPARGTFVRLCGIELTAGSVVGLSAAVRPVVGFRNLTPHPLWPSTRTVLAEAHWLAGTPVQRQRANALLALLERWRCGIRQALRATLPAAHARLAAALVLGDSPRDIHGVDESMQAVRDAGLAHVIAVSGLHVTMIAGAMMLGLHWLLLRCSWIARRWHCRRLAAGGAIPLAWLYALFSGGQASGWRAAACTSLGWLVMLSGRLPRQANVLAASAMVLTALEPSMAWSLAFLLSLSATAALASPLFGHGDASLTPWQRLAAESLRATLATAPLALWCFGSLPLLGVLANLLMVPFTNLVLLPLAHLQAFSAALLPEVGLAMAALTRRAIDAFVGASSALQAISPRWRMPPLATGQALSLAALCWLPLLPLPARQRWLLLCGFGVALLAQEGWLRRSWRSSGKLRVTFLDVGQGDAAWLQLPNGQSMLIDAGGAVTQRRDPGTAVLKPLLQAWRREHLDVAIVSHAHPDHFAGLWALLDQVSIGELWEVGKAAASGEGLTSDAQRLFERWRQRGTRIVHPDELCGRPRWFGKAKAEVLWPCPRMRPEIGANDDSLVVRLSLGSHAFLFTGDLEQAGEDDLLASGVGLTAEVLKVPHHGSRGSSSEAFLQTVRPRLAVVSAGVGNPFGHPHTETLRRLKSFGAQVVGTPEQGGIEVTSDGHRLEFTSYQLAGYAMPVIVGAQREEFP